MANTLPADQTDGTFSVPSRAEIEQTFKTSLGTRVPGIDVSDGSPADVDAKQMAGTLSPGYAIATRVFKASSLQGKRGAALVAELAARGDAPLPAAGASGWVLVTTATTGVTVAPGHTIGINGKTYGVGYAVPTLVHTGDPVPIVGIDVGPDTDQLAGVIGTWNAPPAGLIGDATVMAQANGQGLVGGALEETDDQILARLAYENANPAASGNAAEYIDRAIRTPGLSIEMAWVYPGIQGGNTNAIVFTKRCASALDSRLPSTIDIAKVQAWVPGKMPKSDTPTTCLLVANPITVCLKILWAQGVAAWADPSPWPVFTDFTLANVDGGVAPTATTFRLKNLATPPATGMNIAFYDAPNQVFRLKRILTATIVGVGPEYDVVCDTSGGVSDTTYTPFAGQFPCPWSDALNLLVAPIVAGIKALGPGEQLATFWDPGDRQRRFPPPPIWPYIVTNRLADPLFDIPAVDDVELPYVIDSGGAHVPIPYTTPTGAAAVSSYLTTLASLVAFPE